MITIETRYRGPTNTKGARISVQANNSKSILYVPFDYSKWGAEAHVAAVQAWKAKYGWIGPGNEMRLVGGSSNNGYLWAFDRTLQEPGFMLRVID